MPDEEEQKQEEEQLHEPSGKALEGKVEIRAASSATLRVRTIHHSPVADRKLVKSARKVARELKKKKMQKKDDSITPQVEPPLILPVP